MQKPLKTVAEAGVELLLEVQAKSGSPTDSYAQTYALSPELQMLVDSWPYLTATVRGRITAIATRSLHKIS